MFTVSSLKNDIMNVEGDVLIAPVFEDDLESEFISDLNSLTAGALQKSIDQGDVEGKPKSVSFFPPLEGKIQRLCVVGFGKREDVSVDVVYEGLAMATMASQNKKAKRYVFLCDEVFEKEFTSEQWGRLVVKALGVSTYHFDRFFTKEDAKLVDPEECLFLNVMDGKKVLDAGQRELIIVEAMNWSRDLGNHPAGDMTPIMLADEVREKCKGTGISVRVLNEDAMRELGMGAILGVSKGSHEEAQMVIMEYKGGSKKDAPAVFCGKGITFDSGGISLKPSSKMEEMKFDMLGAATVAGGVLATAKLKLKKNVVGVLACAENLPGGSATRPGDVLRAMNGKTIEVINTDAEGRLVLADALSYVKKYNPEYVVDFATLTGAVIVALGTHYCGLFTDKEAMRDKLMKASRASGDKVWELPVTAEYTEHLKSLVADVKNIGRSGQAGASSAAAFLKEFTDYPWAHVDMASAWNMQHGPTQRVGATGFGVHLIVSLLT